MAGPAAETTAKSVPDLQKLGGMASRVLMVTRLTARSGHEQSIIAGAKGYSVEQIMAIQNTLAQSSGPGTYRFNVFEDGGIEKVEWTVKLGAGPDIPQQQEVPMGVFPVPGAAQNAEGGVGPDGARALGHGFTYDEKLGLLITPQRQAMPWRPGEPWPLGPGASVPAMTQIPGNQPWNPQWGPQPQGWGSYPATGGTPVAQEDETKRELRELKAAMAAREREDAHKAEMARLEKAIEAQGAALAAALAKLSEKPSGPSPTEAALTAQIEELKRQNAEAAARAEATRREDSLRAEMKAQADSTAALIREVKDSVRERPDPMAPLMTQIMTSQQASNTSAMAAVQAATQASAEAAKESARAMADRFGSSILTPERMEAILKIAKDQGPNQMLNDGVLKMYQTLFGMSQQVLQQQAEIYNQAGGPAWVAPVQQGLEQLGAIAKAYATSKAQADGQADVEKQRTERLKAEAARAEAVARANTAAAARAAAAAAARSGESSATEQREAAARQYEARRPAPAPAAPEPAAAAPTNGHSVPNHTAAAVAAVDISKVSPEAIREIIDGFDDATFFGPFHSQVLKLRAANLKPADAANAILAARAYFTGFGELPPAIELLTKGHIDLLTERLFPEAGDIYQRQVADAIRVQLRAETSETATDDDVAET